ncbi:hypothetical protein LTR56_015999 [Elasticomyces elasticus]|nr:hypothetical protein LTR22_025200 [Elasticomyces elasticus]KAK3633085.1 hypothetical protein LTR56_015999 [Elasticomyces elasticus]KAK4917923.1 hypothetical protein LTR49_014198 [Elasticomyces elasticus]KAK5753319.1 hypothetical protein LTS12_016562 [Elasticomyces elasticus]
MYIRAHDQQVQAVVGVQEDWRPYSTPVVSSLEDASMGRQYGYVEEYQSPFIATELLHQSTTSEATMSSDAKNSDATFCDTPRHSFDEEFAVEYHALEDSFLTVDNNQGDATPSPTMPQGPTQGTQNSPIVIEDAHLRHSMPPTLPPIKRPSTIHRDGQLQAQYVVGHRVLNDGCVYYEVRFPDMWFTAQELCMYEGVLEAYHGRLPPGEMAKDLTIVRPKKRVNTTRNSSARTTRVLPTTNENGSPITTRNLTPAGSDEESPIKMPKGRRRRAPRS